MTLKIYSENKKKKFDIIQYPSFINFGVILFFPNNCKKIYIHHDIYDTPIANRKVYKEIRNRLIKYDYILLPSIETKYVKHYKKFSKKIKRLNNFSYSSNTNNHFLNVQQIRKILKEENFI